jgi:DNA-binding NarL/FixJ family response regulator
MRLLLVDDHTLFRRGLDLMLAELQPGVIPVHCASRQDLEILLTPPNDPAFDLILLDLNMPGFFGLQSLQFVKQAVPHIPVIVMSGEEHPDIGKACLQAGAARFVSKGATTATLTEALAQWLSPSRSSPKADRHDTAEPDAGASGPASVPLVNTPRLTERQRSVLRLAAQGKTNKIIGRELGISDGTVKTHLAHLMAVFSVNTRTQLVFELSRQGIRIDEGA